MPAKILTLKPDFSLERQAGGIVCGIDEVGRGPLAGPVVAAAVVFISGKKTPLDLLRQINDSKKISAEKRRKIALALPEFAHTAIGEASVEEIDSINILRASLLAMRRAFEKLPLTPDFALIDGNHAPELPCPCRAVVKGDQLSLSIASASIIAKHYRDMKMACLAEAYPDYGWESNAGYGTTRHMQAIATIGITPHHRRSFAPVREKILATR